MFDLGVILVIAGIVIALIWSLWIGVIVAVVGLVAFGGFAKGSGTSPNWAAERRPWLWLLIRLPLPSRSSASRAGRGAGLSVSRLPS